MSRPNLEYRHLLCEFPLVNDFPVLSVPQSLVNDQRFSLRYGVRSKVRG